MPKVITKSGVKHFPYTKEGRKAAAKARKRLGQRQYTSAVVKRAQALSES